MSYKRTDFSSIYHNLIQDGESNIFDDYNNIVFISEDSIFDILKVFVLDKNYDKLQSMELHFDRADNELNIKSIVVGCPQKVKSFKFMTYKEIFKLFDFDKISLEELNKLSYKDYLYYKNDLGSYDIYYIENGCLLYAGNLYLGKIPYKLYLTDDTFLRCGNCGSKINANSWKISKDTVKLERYLDLECPACSSINKVDRFGMWYLNDLTRNFLEAKDLK